MYYVKKINYGEIKHWHWNQFKLDAQFLIKLPSLWFDLIILQANAKKTAQVAINLQDDKKHLGKCKLLMFLNIHVCKVIQKQVRDSRWKTTKI